MAIEVDASRAGGAGSGVDPTRAEVPAWARAQYGRVMSAWAQDSLELRRRGLDRPSARCGRGGEVLATIGPDARRGASDRGAAA